MVALAILTAPLALADEPRSAVEPWLMSEPGEVTQVLDAFDDGDPVDIGISLGFSHEARKARILRESAIYEPGLTTGGYTSRSMSVANFSESTTRLTPNVEVGVYRDISVHLRMPIILNNSRELTELDGSGSRLPIVAQGAPGETLFSLPFNSPDRSGIEYIAAGVDFGIWNQARDRSKPSWVFGLEGRFPVGEPMHACNDSPKAGQVSCADAGDENRNGQQEPSEGELAVRDSGVSRGTIGLEGHTYFSKRMRALEPYMGLSALFEFQTANSDFGLTDFDGTLVNHPPFVGTIVLGLMVIPFENREKSSRLTFDARVTGQYHSEGRDYSELYDALGASDAPSLREPYYARYRANTSCAEGDDSCPSSVVDESSKRVYFTGLTDVQPYGSFRLSGGATWQAGEYIKFSAAVGYRWDQAHGISADQPCNPDFAGDPERSGPCQSKNGAQTSITGAPNPNYRPTINTTGRRFYVEDSEAFDVMVSATVLF